MGLLSPLFTTYRTCANMARLRRILEVIFRNGLGVFFQKTRHLVRRRFRNDDGTPQDAAVLYARLRKVLEELGPVYVKLGQMLSTRPDLVGADCAAELSLLQDSVSTFPREQARQTLEKELGAPLGELFQEFDDTPVAAASLSQGYRAVLKDGTTVFVKVLRPGALRNIKADLNVLEFLAEQFHQGNPSFRFLMLPRVVKQFRQSLEAEASFHSERGNMRRFALQFQDDPRVVVPRVHENYCTDHVLTMDFIEGLKLDQPQVLREAGLSPETLAETAADLMLKQIFHFGFFHADPHPGNLYALPGNKICYLDFGACGRLTWEERKLFCRLILCILEHNEQHAAQLLLRLCDYDEEPNADDLECAMSEFLDQHFYGPLSQLDVPAAIQQLFTVCRRLKIAMKPHIYLMVRAIGTADGFLRKLNPDYDLEKQLRPALMNVAIHQFSPKKSVHQRLEDLLELLELASRAPAHLRAITTQLQEGRLTFRQEFPQMEEFLRIYNRRQRQKSTAILTAGILLNSTLLLGLKIPPLWNDLSILGALGLSFGILLAALLLIDLARD